MREHSLRPRFAHQNNFLATRYGRRSFRPRNSPYRISLARDTATVTQKPRHPALRGFAMLCSGEVVSSIAKQSICGDPSERFDDRTIQKNGNVGTADQRTVSTIVREGISSDSIY